ncbi:hypothetical protein [uncultured Marixanthomonas sp.]|uniref:hypothetical protein n=1 Tax=uncultured Marixanthomonas sp. TaxID=757245 RepID=UPI0030DDDE8E|tara:strand:+ start:80727 stop:81260 length:534 start_codon:yes stop_codon:yes gene_type:complete
MIKKIFILTVVFSIILSCTSGDESNSEPDQLQNGFTFENDFHKTTFAYFRDDNTANDDPQEIAIVLANVDILNTNQNSGVNVVSIEVFQSNLEEEMLSSLNEYEVYLNVSINNQTINTDSGEIILEEDTTGIMATSIQVNVIEFSKSRLHIEFSFTREDGKEIKGLYNGPYTDLSNY